LGEEQYNIQNNIIKTGVDGTNSKHVSNTLGKLLCSEGETEASQVKGRGKKGGRGRGRGGTFHIGTTMSFINQPTYPILMH
jgi:hypothetical protein